MVLPELKGKLNGLALRVPTPTVSLVDLTVMLEKQATVEEVNRAYKRSSKEAQGIPRLLRCAARLERLQGGLSQCDPGRPVNDGRGRRGQGPSLCPGLQPGPPRQVQNECKRPGRQEGPSLEPLSSKGSGETGGSAGASSIPAASTIGDWRVPPVRPRYNGIDIVVLLGATSLPPKDKSYARWRGEYPDSLGRACGFCHLPLVFGAP
jgi:glyceraldehyde 3-phosphate dehydrogenase-like protein